MEEIKKTSISNLLDTIEQNYGVQQIKENLLALPEQIKEAYNKLNSVNMEIEQIAEKIKLLESEIFMDVAEEIQNGKPKYSNQEARNAEFRRRCAYHDEYKMTQSQLRSKQGERDYLQNELSYLRDKFAAYRKLSNLVAAQLNFCNGRS